jgi:hypothetical protein
VENSNNGIEKNTAPKEYNSVKKMEKLKSKCVPSTKQLKVNSGSVLKKTNTTLKKQRKDAKKGNNLNSVIQKFNKLTKKVSEDPLMKSHEVHFQMDKSKLDDSSSSCTSNLSSEMERGTGMGKYSNLDELLNAEGVERSFKPYALQITKPAWNQQFRSLDLRPRNMM